MSILYKMYYNLYDILNNKYCLNSYNIYIVNDIIIMYIIKIFRINYH